MSLDHGTTVVSTVYARFLLYASGLVWGGPALVVANGTVVAVFRRRAAGAGEEEHQFDNSLFNLKDARELFSSLFCLFSAMPPHTRPVLY